MSELTPCNYCNLAGIKHEAKLKKQKVTIVPSKGKVGSLGGVEVYVHPRGVFIEALTMSQAKRYWVAWMMKITDHCVC
jgi:hypothetical protein